MSYHSRSIPMNLGGGGTASYNKKRVTFKGTNYSLLSEPA